MLQIIFSDISKVLEKYGEGVYSACSGADGERAVISEYSIFHGVTPDTYKPR